MFIHPTVFSPSCSGMVRFGIPCGTYTCAMGQFARFSRRLAHSRLIGYSGILRLCVLWLVWEVRTRLACLYVVVTVACPWLRLIISVRHYVNWHAGSGDAWRCSSDILDRFSLQV
ncbi:hypothetical protein FKP32DRAFT_811262 [Trametes sanguinea]|nr:hypothetical protein FKP32DRAFT_811262 [Trametes sanguinea]